MKRWLLLAACCAAAAGCSDSKVVVRASLDQGGQPIADLPVWLLPYDRKALADSMLRAGEMPEPAIPADLLTQLESLTAREKEAAGDSARRQVQAARRTLQARIDSIKTARRVWRE
ncbi:MAG TPA: hypothetical protein VFQ45_16810, partial [Longimicrobium sp.]|nr:hypothetical protein [Longimicrobium sp.]